MEFLNASLGGALRKWMSNADMHLRAEAHNVTFDEHVGSSRLSAIESNLHHVSGPEGLRRALVDYYYENVRISTGTPVPFLLENSAASSGALSEEQKLIRLEDLREPLRKIGISADTLMEKIAQRSKGAAFVEKFVEEWCSRPDILRNPCAWAAFKDELIPELSEPDWADRLRNSLGLAHYQPSAGPIPVALMEYDVGDVLAQASSPEIAQPFVIPTTFDGGPNSQFFPTPGGVKFGCPMALREIFSDADLVAELIHPKLIYKSQHLKRIGFISTPVPTVGIKEMRDSHLMALRVSVVRDDFGIEL